jgi:hypothetical protein
MLWTARPPTFLDLSCLVSLAAVVFSDFVVTYLVPSVEIHAADVEAMDVRGKDAAEEEDTVEHAIPLSAGQHGDREGREEDVHNREDDAIEQAAHLCVVYVS